MPHPKSVFYKDVSQQTPAKKRQRSRKRRENSPDHPKGLDFNSKQHSDERGIIWEGTPAKSRSAMGVGRTSRHENHVPTQTDPLIVPSIVIGPNPHHTTTEEHIRRKPWHTRGSAVANAQGHDRVQSDSELLRRKCQTDAGRPGVIHLSHDQFSAIADQLVSKMKQELCIDSGAPCRGDSPTNSTWEKVSESPVSEFCSAPEDASDESDEPETPSHGYLPHGSRSCASSSRLSSSRASPACVSPSCDDVPGMLSHYCVICASHMVPPACSPVLLVPCGHTICKSCTLAGDGCPVCHCAVTSTIFNILLQQIVIDYRNRQATGGVVLPDVNRAKNAETQSGATNTKEGGYVGVRTSPREHPGRAGTMNARKETLEAEANTIRALIKQLEHEIEVYVTELRSLSEQEAGLQVKIDSLAMKMKTTRMEREALRLRRQALEEEHVTGKMRLDIIRETLGELRKEEQQMSQLAEITSPRV